MVLKEARRLLAEGDTPKSWKTFALENNVPESTPRTWLKAGISEISDASRPELLPADLQIVIRDAILKVRKATPLGLGE